MDFSSENEQTAQYLWSISNRLVETCPAASRFYMNNLQRNLIGNPSLCKTAVKKSCLYCSHCGSFWAAGNHEVRVKPPCPPSGFIKALLKRTKQGLIPNKRERKLLKKFLEKQTSKIVYTCFLCKKKTEFPGIEKPHRKELKCLSITTSTPKIKLKKCDLNAGLYIGTPENSKKERNSYCPDDSPGNLPEPETLTKVSELDTPKNFSFSKKSSSSVLTPGSASKWLLAKHSTPTNLSHTPHNSVATTAKVNKRKRKTLSAQFLEEKQNSAKKKSNLTSFLVSL